MAALSTSTKLVPSRSAASAAAPDSAAVVGDAEPAAVDGGPAVVGAADAASLAGSGKL